MCRNLYSDKKNYERRKSKKKIKYALHTLTLKYSLISSLVLKFHIFSLKKFATVRVVEVKPRM